MREGQRLLKYAISFGMMPGETKLDDWSYMKKAWWGTKDVTTRRLQLEAQAMRKAFGDTFQLELSNRGKHKGKICWVGEVVINLDTPENPREHLLRIVHPTDYPASAPEAYCDRPQIRSKVHQYIDGELCLYQQRDGVSHGWNPSRSTVVTIAGWAIQWLYAYYTWLATDRWPGQEESVLPKNLEKRKRNG